MMEASGYKHYSKFVIHKKEWDQLIRKIPLGYFNFLGVDRKVLDLTLELDYQEYEDALELPLYPKFATIRLMSAVYTSEKIPGNMIEEEALEYIYEVVKEKGFQCCINYPFLKTIFVDKMRGINTIYYPPEIEFTKLYAHPKQDGRMIGRSCLA